jgi:16S rRNA processing protein RimM
MTDAGSVAGSALSEDEWNACAVVGRVARAHGIRGQMVVNPETDFVEDRFRVGAELLARRGDRIDRVRVIAMRVHLGRPIIALDAVLTTNDAEAMAGVELRVPVAELEALPEGMFYRHDLVGCRVETTDGAEVGEVTLVEGELGASRLVVKAPFGDVLIPLAQAICVVIDIAARRVVIDPPEGLLDLNRRP